LGEFLKWGQWFSKSSRGGYEKPWCSSNQEVKGFNDGEVLQCVLNVDQMLRDIEFQRVYTPSELARLKQFIEDSKKPLYPDCQKFPSLSGDLKLL
jgi:hypothetical protein